MTKKLKLLRNSKVGRVDMQNNMGNTLNCRCSSAPFRIPEQLVEIVEKDPEKQQELLTKLMEGEDAKQVD
jgi:hypothetical protein